MKVLALNSSARTGDQSKTEFMLNHLVEGMRSAGADVEVVNLKNKKINVCAGCYTCWTKAPGQCIHQDDMTRELFPKWVEADLCVYATPLFHHTVNATMKTFIERTLPVALPDLVFDGHRWHHPLRHQPPGAVILSVAGFPALSAFEALSHWARFLFGEGLGGLWAEIYRPGAEALPNARAKKDDILAATRQAGVELVERRAVTSDTLNRIQQPLFDNEVNTFAELANCVWRTCQSEGVTPKEMAKRGMPPRPDTLASFMAVLQIGFNPQGAGDANAVLQFDFTGPVAGVCHFTIADGSITAAEGPAGRPDLVVKTPFDVWIDIMTRKRDGAQAMMDGLYQVEGNTGLLLDMQRFFSRG